MNTLKVFACSLGLAGLIFASGCGSDPIKEMEKIKDEVCKCKDAACVEKAMEKAKNIKEPKDLKEEDLKKVFEIAMEMEKCAKEAAGGGADEAEGEEG